MASDQHHDDLISFFNSMTTHHEHGDHLHDHPLNNLSRLSMCSNDAAENEKDQETDDHSDSSYSFSDSEKEDEEGVCLSRPPIPTERRIRRLSQSGGVKEYVKENEALGSRMRRRRSERRTSFEEGLERSNSEKKREQEVVHEEEEEEEEGEVVVTKAKGGRRSLCMDSDEVKACRDLGFDLEEDEKAIEIPSRLTICTAFDVNETSSGGNSPIASWKISSPGDDPKEVKARLKVWAQAVAMAASPH